MLSNTDVLPINQKHIIQFVLALLAIAVVLLLGRNLSWYDAEQDIAELDTSALSVADSDESDSQWIINGYQSDSLVYWNNLDHQLVDRSTAKTWQNADIQYYAQLDPSSTADHNFSNRLANFILWILFASAFGFMLFGLFRLSVRTRSSFLAYVSYTIGALLLLSILHWIDYGQSFDNLVLTKRISNSFFLPSISSLWLAIMSMSGVALLLHKRPFRLRKKYSQTWAWFISGVILGLGLYAFGYICQTIVQSESIHLDIENILKFDKYSFLVIIMLLLYMLLLFIILSSLLIAIKSGLSRKTKQERWLYAGGLLSIVMASVLLGVVMPIWALAIYALVYMLMLELFAEHRSDSIIWLIWWMVIFASFVAGVIFYNSLIKDISYRSKHVTALYQAADDVTTSKVKALHDTILQSEVISSLSKFPFGKLSREDFGEFFKNETQPSQLLEDYTIGIESYNNHNAPLFSSYGVPYYSIIEELENAQRISSFIWYNPFSKTYYLRYNIHNDIHEFAPFDLIVSVAPPLHDVQAELNNFYVLQDGQIVKSSDPLEGTLDLQEMNALSRDTIIGGTSYVVNPINDQLKIVNKKKISALIKPISLFSYVFSILGVILMLLSLANSRWHILSEPYNIRFFNRDSLRTKIQLVIIVLIVFSFLIIGLMTGYYFNNLLQNNQNKHNKQQIVAIINAIQSKFESIADEKDAIILLNKSIKEISDIHGPDLAVYNTEGQLTSYTDDQESLLRLPMDYPEIVSFTREVVVSNLPKTIVPLQLNKNEPFAYVGITFADNPRSYSSILDFLSTILNVYVFLFLLASAIALAIANSITRPLSVIADKLKSFKLGANNEPLQYEGKDEIGHLIQEYNNLIVQVQDSADIIAQTERDMAWREMAKQVAHEIKNPLTPMKLSIQYLDKMVKSNPDKAREITEKVANTLVTQIDSLTNIANEFSNYATMPRANNSKIVLNEVVEAVHDLFRKREDMQITMSEPIEDLEVYVDRNQLLRILNNLVKNAIQAIPEDRRGKIQIELKKQNGKAIISVKDNGKGIPDYMKQKVFTPNFTTKSSGTGLGLAISANMIDSMNGRIYFETVVNEGTVFYVEIPLIRKDMTELRGKRVSLDE